MYADLCCAMVKCFSENLRPFNLEMIPFQALSLKSSHHALVRPDMTWLCLTSRCCHLRSNFSFVPFLTSMLRQ
jgi:hypothetical protein